MKNYKNSQKFIRTSRCFGIIGDILAFILITIGISLRLSGVNGWEIAFWILIGEVIISISFMLIFGFTGIKKMNEEYHIDRFISEQLNNPNNNEDYR